MEESMAIQLRVLREEQQRLEQLLGHTALGTSFETSSVLHGHSRASPQQRCVRELSAHKANTATAITGTETSANALSAAKRDTNNRTETPAGAPHQSQWSYQDRLKELETLKKKYEQYARTSMSQYLNAVGDYEGYKERRESRMRHVQPFTFESRTLVKPPRIREQRAEADRQAREAALKELRRHPLKAKPVPPSTFMNKYELMVEEWCQRKAAIELMSRERARLAKEEAECVRLSAQSLRKTREELMGVVYGPDGRPITKGEQQRRRAQSAEARRTAAHHASEVPLEVRMHLWPALSDHERVRKERIKYRAAVRKIEVDEEVRQALPLLTSPTPGRCYDAAAGVSTALLVFAGDGGHAAGAMPCFGVGQAIHPASVVAPEVAGSQGETYAATTTSTIAPPTSAGVGAVATAASSVGASIVVPLPPPPSSSAAVVTGPPIPPPPLAVSVPAAPVAPPPPPPPPSVAVPLPPPPACVPPPPPGVVVPTSPAPHQSLSLLSTSAVTTPPGEGNRGAGVGTAAAVPVPMPMPGGSTVPPPPPPSAGAASPSPLISVVPSSVVSPASPLPPQAVSAAVPSTSAAGSPIAAASPPPSTAPAPPPPPSASLPPASPAPAPVPSSTIPATNPTATTTAAAAAASTSVHAGGGAPPTPASPTAGTINTTITAAAAASAAKRQEEEAWRRYNPQLTFKPNVRPGVPNFEALWAKNKTQLAETKKAHPTTTLKPFDLTPSARAEKVVGRRPTRSVSATSPPVRHRSTSRAKKAAAAGDAPAGADTTAMRSSPSASNDTIQPKKSRSAAPRGTRAHALRTEAIYSNYVRQSEEHNKVAEEDEQYWRAVAQRQREVRQRLAGYLTDHHLEHELTIKSKVRALRASMKESEKAAEERLAEMRRRVAEMPPVFAEPVHLHEESRARAAVEQSILQSLKDTGLDGATIKNILATSATSVDTVDAADGGAAVAGVSDAAPATAEDVANGGAREDVKKAGEGATDAPHSPTTSSKAKDSQKGLKTKLNDSRSSSDSNSDNSSSSDSNSDNSSSSDSNSNNSSSSRSTSSAGTHSSAGSRKKDSQVPPRSASLSVPSIASVSVPKPVTPKKEAEYSDDSFEDSSDSD